MNVFLRFPVAFCLISPPTRCHKYVSSTSVPSSTNDGRQVKVALLNTVIIGSLGRTVGDPVMKTS